MKKSLFACTVALILLFASSAFAMDYVLGARAGFFFWSPYYKDMPEGTGFAEMRTGHGGLYGPIFVLNFTDTVALSVSGLFGQQTTQWHSWNGTGAKDDGTEFLYSRTAYVEANRYDVDSALSYALMPGLRLFAGYKFQYMKVNWYSTERIYTPTSPETYKTFINDNEFEFKVPLHGVALGCGYSRSLTDLYFFSVSVSGIYTRGTLNSSQYSAQYNDVGLVPPESGKPNPREETFKTNIHQYGFNIEPSIGIRTSGPIVTLGVRYQLLRTQFYELDSSGGDGPDDRWMNDQLYGVFVAVMFTM
ncbi:MAG: hypothetical protein KBA61_01045 [Spirochaetes bacterium]|nr:hypothetical protein [Spirochaetota bacterium]